MGGALHTIPLRVSCLLEGRHSSCVADRLTMEPPVSPSFSFLRIRMPLPFLSRDSVVTLSPWPPHVTMTLRTFREDWSRGCGQYLQSLIHTCTFSFSFFPVQYSTISSVASETLE